MRPLLAGEFTDREPRLAHGIGAVAVEGSRPGEYQPGLREHDLLTLALDLPHGLLTGLPCLRQQAHRQEQLAAVGENESQP